MSEPTAEQRLTSLERRVSELEHLHRASEARDIALLARVDGFIEDLRRIERVQLRGFEQVLATQQEHSRMLQEQGERLDHIEKSVETLVEVAKDHKAAIERMANGQEQIISLLRGGQAKTND